MKKLIGLLLFLCLFVSCGYIENEIKFDQITFNEQRQKWQESNIKNYKYHLCVYGFTGFDGVVIVENGVFKESLTEDDYYNINYFLEYSTINEIYNTIENTYNEYNNKKYSKTDFFYTEINIEYDKINHIPIRIQYRYYENPSIAIDGDFDYEIKSFEKINE